MQTGMSECFVACRSGPVMSLGEALEQARAIDDHLLNGLVSVQYRLQPGFLQPITQALEVLECCM